MRVYNPFGRQLCLSCTIRHGRLRSLSARAGHALAIPAGRIEDNRGASASCEANSLMSRLVGAGNNNPWLAIFEEIPHFLASVARIKWKRRAAGIHRAQLSHKKRQLPGCEDHNPVARRDS
jgi:hypothetical protein